MEELGYVSGIMRVEGLAETTEIDVDAVESQSSTWGFLKESPGRDHRTVQGRVFWGKGCSLEHLGIQWGWRWLPCSRQRSK